ncbi:MAG: hypothetical protein ACKVVP_04915 [Chloroflexota bacterium]
MRFFSSTLFPASFVVVLVLTTLWKLVSRGDVLVHGHDLTQAYNWEFVTRRALAMGTLPYWNPYILSGMPALADLQTQVFYPPSIALRLLPIHQYFNWSIVVHVVLAGAGTFLLARSLHISRWSALVASTGFMFGGTFSPRIHGGQTVVIAGWAWLPLALAYTLRSVERRTWIPHPVLPIVLACALLTGQTQVTLYLFIAVAAMFIYAGIASARGVSGQASLSQVVAQGVCTLILLIGLSAFQLVPFARLVGESGRSAGLSYDAAARNSIDALHLLTLFAPEAMDAIRPEHSDSVEGSHWERSMFSGAMLALLAPLGVAAHLRARWTAFFVLLGCGAMIIALGRNAPAFSLHYWLFPGLRHASRVLPLFALSLALLGALGLDAILRRLQFGASPRFLRSAWVLIVGQLVVFACLLGALQIDSAKSALEILGFTAWLGCLQAGCLLAALGIASKAVTARVLLGLASGLAILQLGWYASGFIQVGRIPDHRAVLELLGGERVDRLVSNCDGAIPPNDFMELGVAGVNGYNSLFLRDYQDFTYLAMHNAVPTDVKQVSAIRLEQGSRLNRPVRPDLIRLLSVSHVIGCEPVNMDELVEVARRRSLRLYRVTDPVPRARLACEIEVIGDRAELIETLQNRGLGVLNRPLIYGPDAAELSMSPIDRCDEHAHVSILLADQVDGGWVAEVTAPRGGLLLLSEPHYPERRAWLNGLEIPMYRANLAFTAAPVPPGTHFVELRYVPLGSGLSLPISLGALLAWLGLTIAWLRFRQSDVGELILEIWPWIVKHDLSDGIQ